jgi:hypothetical protein
MCVPLQGWNSTGPGGGSGSMPDPFGASPDNHQGTGTYCPYRNPVHGWDRDGLKWATSGMKPANERTPLMNSTANYYAFNGQYNYTLQTNYNQQTCRYDHTHTSQIRMGWSFLGPDKGGGNLLFMKSYTAFNGAGGGAPEDGAGGSAAYSLRVWTKPMLVVDNEQTNSTHRLSTALFGHVGYQNDPKCQSASAALEDNLYDIGLDIFINGLMIAVPGGWLAGLSKLAIGFVVGSAIDIQNVCKDYKLRHPAIGRYGTEDVAVNDPEENAILSSSENKVQRYSSYYMLETGTAQDGIISMETHTAWMCKGWYGNSAPPHERYRHTHHCGDHNFVRGYPHVEMAVAAK